METAQAVCNPHQAQSQHAAGMMVCTWTAGATGRGVRVKEQRGAEAVMKGVEGTALHLEGYHRCANSSPLSQPHQATPIRWLVNSPRGWYMWLYSHCGSNTTSHLQTKTRPLTPSMKDSPQC